jgi:hypothetical protein
MSPSRRNISLFLRAIVVACCVVLAAESAHSQSRAELPVAWSNAAHSLAEKIAEDVASGHTLTIVDVKDITGGAPVDLAGLRQAVQSEILSEGGRLVTSPQGSPPAAADAQVQITVSHDATGYLLVAAISLGGSTQAATAAVAATQITPGPPAPAPVLQRKIVWQQAEPFTDFAEGAPDSDHTLWYILQPDRLVAYEYSGNSQILQDDRPFSRLYTSRDPRGRLNLTDATHVTAWIAAARCDGTWNPGFSLNCAPNVGQQWPMGTASWTYDPVHNYFSGAVTLSSNLMVHYPPFYSAAFSSGSSGGSPSRWILAGLDGQSQLFAGSAQPVATFSGWGSDIVSVASACGPSWQVLVTGPGDWTEPDRIQLYEISGQQATAVGEPLRFPGPILSLWPSADGQSARVVSRNLQTGTYEASIVSVSCSQ